MKNRIGLGTLATEVLGLNRTLTKKDLGDDARLSKFGIAFCTEAWDVEGVGHLCSLKMKAFFGLMQMETIILAPTQVDAPLFNLDWMKVASKEMQIAELYDDQLQPWPAEFQAEFQAICDTYADLPETEHKENWYDSVLYPCSCHKQGKGITERLSALAQDYATTFAAYLHAAPQCDAAAKASKVRAFAEQLVAQGGPAVGLTTKLFGEETARRLVLHHMYGVQVEE